MLITIELVFEDKRRIRGINNLPVGLKKGISAEHHSRDGRFAKKRKPRRLPGLSCKQTES